MLNIKQILRNFISPFLKVIKSELSDEISALYSTINNLDKMEVVRCPMQPIPNVNVSGGVLLYFQNATINTLGLNTDNVDTISLPAGMYEVIPVLNFQSTVQRSNVGIDILIDGSVHSTLNGSNYIRSYNGHNESGDKTIDLIELASQGQLQISAKQMARAGTVQLESGYLIIKKLNV